MTSFRTEKLDRPVLIPFDCETGARIFTEPFLRFKGECCSFQSEAFVLALPEGERMTQATVRRDENPTLPPYVARNGSSVVEERRDDIHVSLPRLHTDWGGGLILASLWPPTQHSLTPSLRFPCPVVPMLVFYRVTADDPTGSVLADQGISPRHADSVRLRTTLDALPAGSGPVLVVDRRALAQIGSGEARSLRVPEVPPPALCNVDPYRPPRPVTAGGGYVGCAAPEDVALLVIHRRGVWDLPKGMKDPGESIEACARREVCEEVGIDTLTLRRSLGTTQHGYPDGDAYAVKTTHWYLMQTPERSFEPERREGIRRVAAGRWGVARRHIGYDTLRRHMDRVEGAVRQTLKS